MATYSINTGTPQESKFLGNLDPNLFLNKLPNNTAQLIVPEDLRDSLYTIWDNITFKQVTINGSSIEYIGIKGDAHTDNYNNGSDGLKILIGKPDLSGVDVMDSNLIGYNSANNSFPDSDIFFYNFKPNDFGGGGTDQQFTKFSFLAGDPSNGLFQTSPYILSQENSGGTAIDLTIYNQGGKLTIDSNEELIIGSPDTKITLLYGTGSTGIKTLPSGNPGDIQTNLDDCEFGSVNGSSASIGNVLIMGSSNTPYWGTLSIDSVFTLNQTLTSGNQTSGKDIIISDTNDSIYVGGTGSTYTRIYHDGTKSIISSDGEFKLDITGVGNNKVLLTGSNSNAYWADRNVDIPEKISLVSYSPFNAIPGSISSSIATLVNVSDIGKTIYRVGLIGQNVSFGAKLRVINQVGDMSIDPMNKVFGTNTQDGSGSLTMARNIYIPNHFSTELSYDPSANVTYYYGQTIEMVYLELDGNIGASMSGVNPVISEGGYWHVTSIT